MRWRATPSRRCAQARWARCRRRRRPTKTLSPRNGERAASVDKRNARCLQLLEQGVAAGDLDLARRFLDIELLHHAVLDQHGIALRARAETVARAVEGQVDRLGEFAVAV